MKKANSKKSNSKYNVLLSVTICLVFPFIVYLITLAPTIVARDSAELITAAHTLSIPHSPGYPLYVILGKIFSLLPIKSIAWRINMMSAFWAACTTILIYQIALILTQDIASSCIGALLFAFGTPFWFYSTSAEIFTLHTFLALLIHYLLIRWFLIKEGNTKKKKIQRQNQYLAGCFFIIGLALTNQHLIAAFIPSIIFFLLLTEKKNLFSLKKILFLLCFLFLGLSLYSFIYFRSKMNPFIDWNNPENLKNFMSVVLRRESGTFVFSNYDPTPWNLFFLWGHLKFYMTLLIDQFHYWGLAFGGYGVYMLLKDKKYIGLLLLLSIIFSGPFLSVLMGNVRPTSNMYFISERFYLGSLGLFAILVSYGIYNVLSFLQKIKYGKIGSVAIIISIGIFMLYHFIQTYPSQDKSNDYLQYDFIENILMTADQNAIFMTSNENIVFGIWYMQAVEGRRKDIKPFLGTSFPPRLEALREKNVTLFQGIPSDSTFTRLVQHHFDGKNNRDSFEMELITKNIERYPIYLVDSRLDDFFRANLIPKGLLYELKDDFIPVKSITQLEEARENLTQKYRYRDEYNFIISDEKHLIENETIIEYYNAYVKLADAYASLHEYNEAFLYYNHAKDIYSESLEIKDKLKNLNRITMLEDQDSTNYSQEDLLYLSDQYWELQRYSDFIETSLALINNQSTAPLLQKIGMAYLYLGDNHQAGYFFNRALKLYSEESNGTS